MYLPVSKICCAAVGVCLFALNAKAETMMPLKPGYFIDGAIGASVGSVSDFSFSNPIGAATTTSAVSGDKIILDNTDETDGALGAEAAIGYRYNKNTFVRFAYSYFDQMEFEGFATFGGNAFQQLMQVDAHALMVELGYDHPLGNRFFLEGAVGAGLAFVSTDARQGLNLAGNYNIFPGNTRTNPAFKVNLGLGYQLSENWGLMLGGDYTYLGRASSGRTGATEVAASTGVNLSEELSGDVSVWRAKVGLRYNF